MGALVPAFIRNSIVVPAKKVWNCLTTFFVGGDGWGEYATWKAVVVLGAYWVFVIGYWTVKWACAALLISTLWITATSATPREDMAALWAVAAQFFSG